MTANLGGPEPTAPLLRVVRDDERAPDFADAPPNLDLMPDAAYADFMGSVAYVEGMSEIEALRLQLAIVAEDRERLAAERDRAMDKLEPYVIAMDRIQELLPERTRDFWEASRILRDIAGILDRTRRTSW